MCCPWMGHNTKVQPRLARLQPIGQTFFFCILIGICILSCKPQSAPTAHRALSTSQPVHLKTHG